MEGLTKDLPVRRVLQPDQYNEYRKLFVMSMGMMNWLWMFTTHGSDATYTSSRDSLCIEDLR